MDAEFELEQIIDIMALANNPLNERFNDMNDIYSLLARSPIGMSWGINSPWKVWDTLLFFKVQWFLLKGSVYITVENDLFTITFTNRAWKIKEQCKWIYLDNLIEVIDARVEKNVSDEKYAEIVEKSMIRL